MRREESAQIFLVFELVLMERIALSSVLCLGQGVPTQNSIQAETLHDLSHDLINLCLGKMLNGGVPYNIIEGTLW
jgi:hypothetical protein